MASVVKIGNLLSQLENLSKKYLDQDPKPSVIVGYSTNYAIHVHENVEMKWRGLPRMPRPPKKGNYWDGRGGAKGQAKFLEQPARELTPKITERVVEAMKGGATLLQALYIVGLLIQRNSQQLVPVDTGALKASAFTRKETHNSS